MVWSSVEIVIYGPGDVIVIVYDCAEDECNEDDDENPDIDADDDEYEEEEEWDPVTMRALQAGCASPWNSSVTSLVDGENAGASGFTPPLAKNAGGPKCATSHPSVNARSGRRYSHTSDET